MGHREKAMLMLAVEFGLGKDPGSSGISCVQKAGKAHLEGGRRHPIRTAWTVGSTALPKGVRHGPARCTARI